MKMKSKMYVIYDSKMEAYMSPWLMPARGAAIRNFMEAAKDSQSQVCKHPGDFTLFEIGEFDDATGIVTMHKAHENLGTALDIVGSEADTPKVKAVN